MEIRLIAMDMDGTLLTGENKISDKTKEALLQVQSRGIRLALASGRSWHKLMSYARELQMERYGGYLVEVNGMAVYDLAAKKRYVKKRMPKEDAQRLFRYFSQYPVEIIAHLDDGMFDYNPKEILEEKKRYMKQHGYPADCPYTGGAFSFVYDNRKGYPDLRYISCAEEIDEDVNKLSVTYWPQVMERVSALARRDLSAEFWVGRTTEKWLEIMMKDVTKAKGLKSVCELTQLSMENVMAFGDGENDVEMLRECGLGIAMGNALPAAKEAADEITLSNLEDGIAAALQRYDLL